MNDAHKAIKVKTADMPFGWTLWNYRGHDLRYIAGSGRGYPWTYYYAGSTDSHRGFEARTKAEAMQSIDDAINSGRISDLGN